MGLVQCRGQESEPSKHQVCCKTDGTLDALAAADVRKRDLSARSRHIRVQLGFVYDALDSGEVEIRYVRSAANPANQLTAPEVADRLARTIDAMSGRPAEGPPLVVDENA